MPFLMFAAFHGRFPIQPVGRRAPCTRAILPDSRVTRSRVPAKSAQAEGPGRERLWWWWSCVSCPLEFWPPPSSSLAPLPGVVPWRVSTETGDVWRARRQAPICCYSRRKNPVPARLCWMDPEGMPFVGPGYWVST